MKLLPKEVQNLINSQQLIPDVKSIVKELLENSLDAGADRIELDLFSSKIKSASSQPSITKLTLKDNGRGIPYDYFPSLCKRHYTSKIGGYQDLRTCSTFGFRGEALHGMSFMSNLTVVSNHNQDFGFRFAFLNGRLLGDFEDPEVVERERGTTVVLENIFRDNLVRKAAHLKVAKVLKDVEKVFKAFAVHFYEVGFCVKLNSQNVLLATPRSQKKERIRDIFSVLGQRELLTVQSSCDSNADFHVECIFSEPNSFKTKKKCVRNPIHSIISTNII